MIDPTRFNIRVYAILMNECHEVLISDERQNGHSFTKFPGGGLEFGEGLTTCLARELNEELGIDATIGKLFYVNDFYQQSAFRATDQLVSFYHFVDQFTGEIETSGHTIPLTVQGEKFRWVSISELSEDMFTFPIDKIVGQKLKESF